MQWDEYAAGWDEDPGVVAYAQAAFETLSAQLESRDIGLGELRVLDFGCGTGQLTQALAPLCTSVVALDTSTKMIEVLDAKVRALAWTHVRARAQSLESFVANEEAGAAASFDLVVCSSVCAFVDDYPATARQLVALLKPGGVFVQFDWERDEADEEPFGLSRAEISTALHDAGLERVVVDTAFERAVGESVMRPLMGIGSRPA